MAIYRVTIPFKLPSCNDYINACRRNKYAAAKMKADVERDIGVFISQIPHIDKPVTITFTWIEESKRRDLDGICFAKKFILDAMVKQNVLTDDNRNCVTGFTDTFEYGEEAKVILEIMEVEE